jgi:uncharacterized RmlC-like cupin family protein
MHASVTKDDGPRDLELITVRPDTSVMMGRQHLPYFVGISRNTAGSDRLAMNLVVIPPGGAAEPHYHQGYETAIYILKGRIETRYGIGLKKSVIHEAGDFVFIPPNVPHQPVNLSATEVAQAIVARTDANEQETVVPYPAQVHAS